MGKSLTTEVDMNEKIIKRVNIPASTMHMGMHNVYVNLNWVCPLCGGPRGEVKPIRSYDGSLSMMVDGWQNPCGHVDYYSEVREEAFANGLNKSEPVGYLGNAYKNQEVAA